MKTKAGFTLIELLVVVLIIGILAAIALPQYQFAVIQARLAKVKALVTTIARAEEIYYLEHGQYADYVAFGQSQLDVDFSAGCHSVGWDNFTCDNYFLIGPIQSDGSDASMQNISAYYCPNLLPDLTKCGKSNEFYYRVYFKHSSRPNEIECVGRTNLGKKICNSL